MKSINNISENGYRLKVMTVVGTRPEIIRLSRTIVELDKHCNHLLVHTGQNYDYELNQIFFEDLDIRPPDIFLECAGDSPAKTIAEVISRIDLVLEVHKPEAVLILGDTNSSMAAIAAKRRQIPIFHMEAGNRCFDLRVPEEINRKIIDHISDVNMPYSDIARNYLIREGISPDLIVKTGSPMDEVISFYGSRISKSDVLGKLNLQSGGYFVVSAHRQENIDSKKNIFDLVSVLNSLSVDYRLPIFVTTHPRTRQKIEELGLKFNSLVSLHKPLGFTDYVNLQKNAKAVLSDSGTITEESSILNFPAINIRDAHERPEGMEEGAVMFTGLSYKRIRQALEILYFQESGNSRTIYKVNDYEAPNVSAKVVRTIVSYTDYVQKVVWKKY